MNEFKSNFNDGTGELNIQYEGTSGTTEAPVTSDCNCGEDRTVQVNFITDDGGASKTVTVNQEGVREQFIPADQTEGIRGSDGELFLGIKEKYADEVPDCCKPQDYLVYTTTSDNQSVQIIYEQEYAQRIYLEDGTELDVSGTGKLNYTFQNAGEHKVWIEFKEDVTDFSNCFYRCAGLTSIPENLFAANTAVTEFRYCFYGCTNITSSCPIDNDGTPIYNRSSGKDGYAVVTSNGKCFYNCTKMADYDSIPSGWK